MKISKYNDMLAELKQLEKRIRDEMFEQGKHYKYVLENGKVIFDKKTSEIHKSLSRSLIPYLFGTRILVYLSAPVIYALLVPMLFLNAALLIYQAICFPIYRIPKVQLREYVVQDRHILKYLNIIEKINCAYCAYGNGLMAYGSEIAARTEQYWCPIKHALNPGKTHSRYHLFFDYGDPSYVENISSIRKQFEDLVKK